VDKLCRTRVCCGNWRKAAFEAKNPGRPILCALCKGWALGKCGDRPPHPAVPQSRSFPALLLGTLHWILPGKTTRCEKALRENQNRTSPRRQLRTTSRRVARPSNCRSHHSRGCPVLRVLCEEPALSGAEGAGTTTAYTTGSVERTRVGRVAQAFDLAGNQQHRGCPALAFFARAGVGNACVEWV